MNKGIKSGSPRIGLKRGILIISLIAVLSFIEWRILIYFYVDDADTDASASEYAEAYAEAKAYMKTVGIEPPKPIEDHDWRLYIDDANDVDNENDRRAILSFADKASLPDDQDLKFLCLKGDRKIYTAVKAWFEVSILSLTSGTEKIKLNGSYNGEQLATEEFASDAPFMLSFAKNGWLAMTASTNTGGAEDAFGMDMVSATPEGASAITRFLEHCNTTAQTVK